MSDDEVRQLIRALRRSSLEARTLSVTLQSSIATLHEIPDMSRADAIARRREWCRMVRHELDGVRARVAANQRLATELGNRLAGHPGSRQRLRAQLADAEAELLAAEGVLRTAGKEA